MLRHPCRWIGTGIALTWALTAREAIADDQAASALIEQGLDLRQAHRDADALALFEKAEVISPTPRGRAQVALAEQALGRWVKAEGDLRAALAIKDDEWIESRRPVLEKALAAIGSHLGDVDLAGVSTGEVFIDGEPMADPDARGHFRLEAGRRTLEVRAPGMYPISRILDVLPGEVVRVEVTQRPLLPEGTVVVSAQPTPRALPAAAPPPARSAQRTAGWISLGAAGAFLVVGVAGVADHQIAAGDFNGDSSCTGARATSLPPMCSGWLSDGSTGRALSIVGFVGAGALGALGVTLVLVAPSGKPKVASLVPWCSPGVGGAGGAMCGVGGVF
jgi:hypothetical protein